MSTGVVAAREPLYTGAEWDFGTLRRIHDACEEVALGELGLSVYPNRIEVISAEQMLDAYASVGLPLFYRHWSFGKHFAQHEALYRKGLRGLAYEIVINSDPCLSYVMEENTATLQAVVIAHAAFGHNHFFRNNRLFLDWTDAKGILDYLEFAKGYVQHAEEKHGEAAVERLLELGARPDELRRPPPAAPRHRPALGREAGAGAARARRASLQRALEHPAQQAGRRVGVLG